MSALVYSATSRCRCGAGLCYEVGAGPHGKWECDKVVRGLVALGPPPSREVALKPPLPPGWTEAFAGVYQDTAGALHDCYSFTFYEIKSESQPSAGGATTRPADVPK